MAFRRRLANDQACNGGGNNIVAELGSVVVIISLSYKIIGAVRIELLFRFAAPGGELPAAGVNGFVVGKLRPVLGHLRLEAAVVENDQHLSGSDPVIFFYPQFPDQAGYARRNIDRVHGGNSACSRYYALDGFAADGCRVDAGNGGRFLARLIPPGAACGQDNNEGQSNIFFRNGVKRIFNDGHLLLK